MYYKSGVITSTSCGTYTDHVVLIVGWGKSGSIPFWIIKNQWGTSWGEGGYAKIKMTDGNGICGINTDISYPIL